MNYKFSTPKTISVIIVYFLLFLAGDLLGSLIFDFLFSIIDLPVRELYPIIRMPDYLALYNKSSPSKNGRLRDFIFR